MTQRNDGGPDGPEAQLLIEAVNALPELLSALDAQTAEIARLREQIKDMDVVGLAYEQRDLPSPFGGPGSPNAALAQEGSWPT